MSLCITGIVHRTESVSTCATVAQLLRNSCAAVAFKHSTQLHQMMRTTVLYMTVIIGL